MKQLTCFSVPIASLKDVVTLVLRVRRRLRLEFMVLAAFDCNTFLSDSGISNLSDCLLKNLGVLK